LIKPDYAVISTASRENTDLPANWRWRALERLQKYCGKIYKTYESGNIVFLTDGDTVKVETEK
jgi:beta-lactamase superfamily II metal-dependent hydrolase